MVFLLKKKKRNERKKEKIKAVFSCKQNSIIMMALHINCQCANWCGLFYSLDEKSAQVKEFEDH